MNSNFPSYSRTKCASNLDYYYSMCTSAIILLLDMFSLSIAIVDKPQWNYWIARCRHRCFFSILLTHSSWKSTKKSHFSIFLGKNYFWNMGDLLREYSNPDFYNDLKFENETFWWFLHNVLSMLTFRIFFIVLLFSFVFSSLCSSCSGSYCTKIPIFVQKVKFC